MALCSSEDKQQEDQRIAALDSLFAEVGLVRKRCGKTANVLKVARQRSVTPEELRKPLLAIHHHANNGVQWLAAPGWEKSRTASWLWHGFSTRLGGTTNAYGVDGAEGELNLGFTREDKPANVEANRRRFTEAVCGSSETPLRILQQIHSGLILNATNETPVIPCKGDGWMTAEPGVLLSIQTADCIPVLVADKRKKVVAAFHAGWRGTVSRIVERGIGRMRVEFGSRPEDLIAAIGPGVGPCCYAVGEEVLSAFESQFAYSQELVHEVYDTDPIRTRYPMLFLTQRAPGHSDLGPNQHLDLVEANRRQLVDAGVKPRSIRVLGGCTSCQRELFFSYRASHGYTGRMMSVIGIRPR